MKVAIDPGHGMSNRQFGVFDPGPRTLKTERGIKKQTSR